MAYLWRTLEDLWRFGGEAGGLSHRKTSPRSGDIRAAYPQPITSTKSRASWETPRNRVSTLLPALDLLGQPFLVVIVAAIRFPDRLELRRGRV